MRTAIKSLEIIKEMYEYFVKKYRDLEPNLMICEKEDFDNVEKHLKALEIIKEKTLTINDLYWLKNGNYKEYRKNLEILYSGVEEEHLRKILKTQEEFDLLKEVLS